MLPNVVEFLLQYPLDGYDKQSLEQWRSTCEASWKQLAASYLTKAESREGGHYLDTFLDAYEDLARLVEASQHSNTGSWSIADRRSNVEALLARPQVEQRTESWYEEAAQVLTASQFATILKPGLTRAKLVLEKANPVVDPTPRRNVVTTAFLNPFTWGIRFEPVVKSIQQDLTKTKVAELGRLRHATNTHLAASPDGLVIEGPAHRLGRFVEFKAPITRPILQKVPEDYMTQMQIQMEVGNIEECDYFEVKFQSASAGKEGAPKVASAKYWGCIAVQGNPETQDATQQQQSLLNMEDRWEPPPPKEGEALLEIVPWWTAEWYMTTVSRSRTWFASVQPAIESFWADVALAKKNEFIVPESKRKAKGPTCRITDDSQTSMLQFLEEPKNELVVADPQVLAQESV